MRLLTVTILCLCIYWTQAAASEKMSLGDCMLYAIENSADIQIISSELDDRRLSRRDAILQAFTPEISAGTNAYSNFGRSVDPETNTYVSTTSFNNGYNISGSIMIFDGFSAINNMKISKVAMQMGFCQKQLEEDRLCLAVMEAYCNAVYYHKLAEICQNQTVTAQKSLKLTKEQEKLGQKGYADVIEMEAELSSREYSLVEAQNKYKDAILTLKALMFWPMNKDLDIDTSIAEIQPTDNFTPYNLTQPSDSLAQRQPSVIIAGYKLKNAKTELNDAKWKFTPRIGISAGWSTNYYTYPGQLIHTPSFSSQFANNGGEFIQITLSFPIFNRLQTFSNLKRKKNAYDRAVLQYEKNKREIQAEMTRTMQDCNGASAAFDKADRMAERQKESYRINVRKFEQGLISPIDFRKASDNWLEAESVRLNAILTLHIKQSVVKYYNGIRYIYQQ